MFRKIVTAIVVVPLAAVIIAFAVANRQTVMVSFDPFSSTSPAYAATLPLFVVRFASPTVMFVHTPEELLLTAYWSRKYSPLR